MDRFLDVVYAALTKDADADGRARLDAELALPLGRTLDDLEREQAEVMASHGW